MKYMNVEITSEMSDHFEKRTLHHISLVQKYLKAMMKSCEDFQAENSELYAILKDEYNTHDKIKFESEEFMPYVLIQWRYKKRDEGDKSFDYSKEVQDAITEATAHHIKNSKHHPDYWIPNKESIQLINPNNRDKPLDTVLDVTEMPLEYICCMVADWMAMSEEKGTDPNDWAKNNINVRWKFTDEQEDMIYALIKDFWRP